MKTKASGILIALLLAGQIGYSLDGCRALLRSFVTRPTDLYFKEVAKGIEEHSIRKEKTAALVYLDYTQNEEPYFFVAFPAGNSGVGAWFKSTSPSKLESSEPVPIRREASPKNGLYGHDGLNGVEFIIKSATKKLSLEDHVLGSMRFIRDREINQKVPLEVHQNKVEYVNGKIQISRPSLNELASYILEIEPIKNTQITQRGESYDFTSTSEVTLKIRALTGEPPITPVLVSEVFKDEALKKISHKKLDEFAFLVCKEKLMAGSPRYFSKFGRDSIYSLYMLMDLMKPEAIESILTAVLSSMDSESGLISHEQSEGDYASWDRKSKGLPYRGISKPIEDYKMIDGEFAFAIAFAKYAKIYPERLKDFVDRKEARNIGQKKLLNDLFNYILKKTKAFADKPVYKNLVSLNPGEPVGNWRDSENGLGGGKYPFDVNAALVPGALRAMSELDLFFNEEQKTELARRFQVWNSKVIPLFEIHTDEISFPGVSIDERGKPVPIIHSDDSFVLAFGEPSESYLRDINSHLRHLATPVGVPVADARYATSKLKEQFDNKKYHGYVSWTMVENMILFGIEHQVLRNNISSETKTELRMTRDFIKHIVTSKAEKADGTEVFSIVFLDGKYEVVPLSGDAKSNSNQLWSHLNLVVNH